TVHVHRNDFRQLFSILLGEIAKTTRFQFVFGGRLRMLEFNEKYQWELLKLCHPIALQPIDSQSAEALITEPTKGHLEWEKGAIERLFSLTGGHPYFLQYLCSRVVQHQNRTKTRTVIAQDVEEVVGEFASSYLEITRLNLLYEDFGPNSQVVERIARGMPADALTWRPEDKIATYVASHLGRPHGNQTVASILGQLCDLGICELRRPKAGPAEYRLRMNLLSVVFPSDVQEGEPEDVKTEGELKDLILASGETDTFEIKGSVFNNLDRYFCSDGVLTSDKGVTEKILETIAAFMNKSGGKIAVGLLEAYRYRERIIQNRGSVLEYGEFLVCGVELDFDKAGWDGLVLRIQNLVAVRLGKLVLPFIVINRVSVKKKQVCVISVRQSPEPCFLDRTKFFVRFGPQNRLLDPPEMLVYLKSR
ncbi:MAG: ATP-binding protein, partial [Candidatus Coatesbacteria bacterium]